MLEELVEKLTQSNPNVAYQALKQLLEISEKGNEVYAYMDTFIEMMEHNNSYVRTRGLRLFAYNSKWDAEGKVNAYLSVYLMHLEDEKPITSRQCIKDTVRIAKYKPELIDQLLDSLEHSHTLYQESMQHLIYQDRKKAIQQIKQYSW